MTYTTLEAAQALGLSRERVQKACVQFGLGRRERPGHPRYLSEQDVEVIRSRIGKRGRPYWLSNTDRTSD